MPNKPDPKKTTITTYLLREDVIRLERLAEARNQSRSNCAASIIREGVSHIELTSEDYKRLAREMEEAERKNKEN